MTSIKTTIFKDAEGWLKENLKDFTVDNVSAVYPSPTYKFGEDFSRRYYDEEEDESKVANMADHVKALQLLCELIDGGKLFVGCIKGANQLTEPCNWDVEVVDAYFQLIYHGEVIYG